MESIEADFTRLADVFERTNREIVERYLKDREPINMECALRLLGEAFAERKWQLVSIWDGIVRDIWDSKLKAVRVDLPTAEQI